MQELKARGVHPGWAVKLGNTRKGPWRISKHGSLHQVLPERYFTISLGLALPGSSPA